MATDAVSKFNIGMPVITDFYSAVYRSNCRGASWSHGDDVASPGIRPVIDGGLRGVVGVATQVSGASCVDVAEADTYA